MRPKPFLAALFALAAAVLAACRSPIQGPAVDDYEADFQFCQPGSSQLQSCMRSLGWFERDEA
jgi:hypothetical protein